MARQMECQTPREVVWMTQPTGDAPWLAVKLSESGQECSECSMDLLLLSFLIDMLKWVFMMSVSLSNCFVY